MLKPEFLGLVQRWSEFWDRGFEAGEPEFGIEEALDDWLGSIDAYVRIQVFLGNRPSDLGLMSGDWAEVFGSGPASGPPPDE